MSWGPTGVGRGASQPYLESEGRSSSPGSSRSAQCPEHSARLAGDKEPALTAGQRTLTDQELVLRLVGYVMPLGSHHLPSPGTSNNKVSPALRQRTSSRDPGPPTIDHPADSLHYLK